MQGIAKTPEQEKERRKKLKRTKLGNKNPMWKGDKVGYIPLHQWIGNHKPKPKFCEICKKNKPYDLANISGEYKRDVNDFKWLCRSCHMKSDGRMENLYKNRQNSKRKHIKNLIQCLKCNEFKTKEEFYKHKKTWDGLTTWCKGCYKKHDQSTQVKDMKKRYYHKRKEESS